MKGIAVGDLLQWVGYQGGVDEPCEVIKVDGDRVWIRFQVYGEGPFHETEVRRTNLFPRRTPTKDTR